MTMWGRPRPRHILIVCRGNICRSPFAAALLARHLEGCDPEIEVASAGFLNPGRLSPPDAQATAARWDVDLTSHRSHRLSFSLAQAADLIVVMDATQRTAVHEQFGRTVHDVVVLGDCDPRPIATRSIADPFGEGRIAYERSYARIARCIGVLASALCRLREPIDFTARPSDPNKRVTGSMPNDRASTTPGRQSSRANSS